MSKLTTLASLGFALVFVSIAQAEDIIDAHIKALGGKDAIGKIKTIRRTGNVNGQGSIERSCIVGKKAIQSTGSDPNTYVMAWNGKEAWVNLGAGVREASPVIHGTLQGWAAVNQVVQMAGADRADTFKFLGVKEFEGDTCEAAELIAAPGIVFYFDKESKMLVGITGATSAAEAGGDYSYKVKFSDFAKHEGVMFPGTETTRLKTGSGEMILAYQFTKTEINANLDDALFEKPKTKAREVDTPERSAELQVLNRFVGTWEHEVTIKAAGEEAIKVQTVDYRFWSRGGQILHFSNPTDEPELHLSLTYDPESGTYPGVMLIGATRATVTGTWDAKRHTMIFAMKYADGNRYAGEHRFIGKDRAEAGGTVENADGDVVLEFQWKQTRVPETSNETNDKARQIVSSMDADRDGKISKDEASEDLKLFFEQYDVNKDEAIDLEEARALAQYVNREQTGSSKPAPSAGRVTAEQIIGYMDKNGDGKLSKDEASDEVKPHFEALDTNGDGAIDVNEAQVMADYANRQQGR